jgi:hypothetical protein
MLAAICIVEGIYYHTFIGSVELKFDLSSVIRNATFCPAPLLERRTTLTKPALLLAYTLITFSLSYSPGQRCDC